MDEHNPPLREEEAWGSPALDGERHSSEALHSPELASEEGVVEVVEFLTLVGVMACSAPDKYPVEDIQKLVSWAWGARAVGV